jgi:hypothetical protein
LTSDGSGVGSWTDVSSTAGPWTLADDDLYPDSTSYNVAIGAQDAGTAKLYVAGNVGIGTTGPNQMLDIQGSIEVGAGNKTTLSENTLATTENLKLEGGSTGYQRNIYFYTVQQERMRIDNSGNVGIGTTGPGAKLDINTATNVVSLRAGEGSSYKIDIYGTTSAANNYGAHGSGPGIVASRGLYLNSGSGYDVIVNPGKNTIFYAGNVGIGTTGPSDLLEVSGGKIVQHDGTEPSWGHSPTGLAVEGISEFDGATYFDNNVYFLSSNISIHDPGGGWSAPTLYLKDDVSLSLGTSLDTTMLWETEESTDALHLLLDSSGKNLVIGDIAYRTKAFDHGASSNPTIFVHSATDPDTDNTEWGSLSFEGTGGGDGYFYLTTGTGDLVLNPSGNVGIGTTGPDSLLHVVGGDVYVAGDSGYVFNNPSGDEDLYVEGNLEVDGTIYGAGGTLISGSGTQNYIPKWSTSSSLTDSLIYDDGTNIGIGTTAPDGLFDIRSTTSNEKLRLSYSSSIYATFSVSGTGGLTVLTNSTGSNEDIELRTPSFDNALYIDESEATLGIGTNTPAAKLHVSQTAASDAFRVDDESSDVTPFIIDEGGNVGIGTTNPSYPLDVVGDISTSTLYKIGSATVLSKTGTRNILVGEDAGNSMPSSNADDNTLVGYRAGILPVVIIL